MVAIYCYILLCSPLMVKNINLKKIRLRHWTTNLPIRCVLSNFFFLWVMSHFDRPIIYITETLTRFKNKSFYVKIQPNELKTSMRQAEKLWWCNSREMVRWWRNDLCKLKYHMMVLHMFLPQNIRAITLMKSSYHPNLSSIGWEPLKHLT